MSDSKDTKTGTGTAERVMTLLTLLADSAGPVSVRAAADDLGLPPSTTHRLLNLLVQGGFASFDQAGSTYSVGSEFFRLSARVAATVSPAAIARGVISDLASRYDETVLFGLLLPTTGKISFIERADGQNKLLYRIDMNTPLSLVWGASGKAALAYMPEAEMNEILAQEGASPATGEMPASSAALAAELKAIREAGFCVSHGEKLPGALGIAAPVFDPHGVIGTICMTMPQARAPTVSTAELGGEVAISARELTHKLGGATP